MARPKPRRLLSGYVTAVIVAGIVVVAGTLAGVDGPLLGARPATFLIFLSLLLFGELRPIRWLRRWEGGTFTATWTFACSLLLIAPAGPAMLATAAASLLADLSNRVGPSKALFNASNLAISMGAGAFVLNAAGRGSLLAPTMGLARYLPLAVLGLVVIFVTNAVLTSIVIALSQEVPLWPMVTRGVGMNLSTDGMLLALAPIFVVVAERSLLLIPLLLLTAWAVYRSAELALLRQHEAMHDQLTNLLNRGAFHDHLEQAIAEAERRGHGFAVVMLDLDGFKEINDRLTHHVGDMVLRAVAERLQGVLRPSDLVARLGGDEFAILLSRVDEAEAVAITERFCRMQSEPLMIQNFPVTVGGSHGIALYPQHGPDVETLMRNADVAMYSAKNGQLGTQLYSPVRDGRSRGRLALLSELQRGIENHELVLHYQPKISLFTNEVVGVEALVRWVHPTQGLIPPDDFMPLAEHTELMTPFTEEVLRMALRQCAQWHRQGLHIPVAVNGSARNLHDLRFPEVVRRLLVETGVEARWLELEITENTVMADPARTATILRELRAIGVSLSIDDFGTGYSSLANLRQLPVDRIKIDRQFVKNLGVDAGDAVIVRSIVNLAHSLGLGSIAEGVEDIATLEALRELGAHAAQGYLFSRPLPADQLLDFVMPKAPTGPPAWLFQPQAQPQAQPHPRVQPQPQPEPVP